MAFDRGLADRIRTVLEGQRGISERKMFGGLAFLKDGHMVCGVLKDNLMLRLGKEGAAVALTRPFVRPMDFTGKPLASLVYVDAQGLDSEAALRGWVETAVLYAGTLPPKSPASR